MLQRKTLVLLVLNLLIILFPFQNQNTILIYESEHKIPISHLRGNSNEGKVNPNPSNKNPEQPFMAINAMTSYTVRSPIKIFNDSAFGASGYNFSGNGSQIAPYIITNYSITDSSETLIHIENTTAYFVIQDCFLDGISQGFSGVYFANVTFGTISNNSFVNNLRGVHSDRSTNLTIENNSISSLSSEGIRFFDTNHSIIAENIITNTAGRAIYLYSSTYWISQYNIIANNTIQSITSHGIHLGSFCSNNLIINNTITDVAVHGIAIGDRCNANPVIYNRIANTGGSGVWVWWWTSWTNITNNVITNSTEYGIWLKTTVNNAIISGNTITNIKLHGLYISSSDSSNVTQNTIINCSTSISLYASDDNTFSDNILSESYFGISIPSDSNFNTLERNTASLNTYDGFLLDGSSNNILINNTVEKNENYGIELRSAMYNTLAGNLVDNNTISGLYLENSSNNILSENYVYRNSGDGFFLNSSYNNTLSKNTANKNVNDGFRLNSGSNNNTLTENTASWNLNGFSLANSHNNSLAENNATKNIGPGFYLSTVNNSSITGNSACENTDGFYLWESTNNNITGNTACENTGGDGFSLWNSNNNTVIRNDILYNNQYGILLSDSSHNLLYLNIFIKNIIEPQAYDLTGENSWTNSSHGNYWSDYSGLDANNDGIGDTFYVIDSVRVYDSKPIMLSTSLSNLQLTGPGDITIEVGSVESYLITWLPTTNLIPIGYLIYQDNMVVKESDVWKSGDPIQWVVNVKALVLGRAYNYTFVVSDHSGKTVSNTVIVKVEDSIAPVIINMSVSEISFEAGSVNSTLDIIFSVSDRDIDRFTLYQNGTTIASWNWLLREYGSENFTRLNPECWQAATENVAENIVVHMDSLVISSNSINLVSRVFIDLKKLKGGVYNFTLVAQDFAGNTDSLMITVIVTGSSTIDSTPGWTELIVLLSLIGLCSVFSWHRKGRKIRDSMKKEVY
ncbi:MAG: right-handed parallel beta-helix repeat-containing protein [Candidatus Hodarchaeales archaeon]|jgi:parallel beta-helix repeat protein